MLAAELTIVLAIAGTAKLVWDHLGSAVAAAALGVAAGVCLALLLLTKIYMLVLLLPLGVTVLYA